MEGDRTYSRECDRLLLLGVVLLNVVLLGDVWRLLVFSKQAFLEVLVNTLKCRLP